ncbi:BA14K family protein [Bradyrhizobium ontarionense]|uniref:BA14K family protein n=1 Tax=Bradyrhizobium ontarionense TaxID=2898149 RepID=A0ABY3RIQ9_9BRAD|nr:BA14K family protein [Bradyrhizobium sp. A19]UFZ06509.1 BA14K family protein [Bradyrhizobium sp. A19]
MRMLGLKAGRAGLLCGVFLFQVAAGVTVAQSAEPGGSPPSAGEVAGDAAKGGGPFGGCEPIGLTASGELVFPLECKKVIKKPAEAPVAADDKTAAEDKTASTEARPAVPNQSAAAADKPAATDAKPAANEAAAAAAASPVSAEPKLPVGADKPASVHKAASLDPAAVSKPSMGKPSMSKAPASRPVAGNPASTRAASGKPMSLSSASSKTASGKPSSSKTMVVAVKDPAPKSGQIEPRTDPKAASKDAGKDIGKPTALSAIKSMIVMARPSAAATPVAARSASEDRPRLRTAGMSACVQFRSYNPATRSYRGFDGHIYACR